MGRSRKKAAARKQREAIRVAPAVVVEPVDDAPAPPPPLDPEPESIAPRPKPVRPTPEQVAKLDLQFPEGPEHRSRPVVNLRPDCIAALIVAVPPLLSDRQHEAARGYQELRVSVLAELGVSQGRSCLDMAPSGHDETDGDPALAERWRAARAALGPLRVKRLDRTCVDGAWPADMDALREALDTFAAGSTRRLTRLRKVG